MYTGRHLSDREYMKHTQTNEYYLISHPLRKNITTGNACVRIRDVAKYDKNFNCPAYNDMVVMTPDYKIYPCNFLISKEEEIGYYKDGKIYVVDDYECSPNECLYCKKRSRGEIC